MMMYPSLRLMAEVLRTNMNGKMPTMKVMVKEMMRAARALSFPLSRETKIENSMNSALTSSAYPTFLLMPFQFIRYSFWPASAGVSASAPEPVL